MHIYAFCLSVISISTYWLDGPWEPPTLVHSSLEQCILDQSMRYSSVQARVVWLTSLVPCRKTTLIIEFQEGQKFARIYPVDPMT